MSNGNFHSIGIKLDANGVAIGIDQTTKSIKDLGVAEDKTKESTKGLSEELKSQGTAAQQAIASAKELSAANRESILAGNGLTQARKDQLIAIEKVRQAEASFRNELRASSSEMDVYSKFHIKSYQDRVAGVKSLTAEMERLRAEHAAGNIGGLEYTQTARSLEGAMNQLTHGSSRARSEFHRMAASMASLTFEMTGAVYGFAMVGAALASPAIIGGKYLKDMEDLKLGITSVVLAMGTIDGRTLSWGQASSVADEQMKKLQNTAMFMAGTTQDLAKAFQAVATQGLEAGMTIDQIRTIAIAGVAAGRALGISATTLQRDIRDMVLGIRPNSTILSASLGITKADIDVARASSGGLFEYLDGKLKGFIIASAEYNKTFSGMFEQMSEMFSRAMSESSVDIFKGVKDSMKVIMDMIGSINDKTKEFTVNPKLKGLLDSILANLNEIFNVFMSLAKVVPLFFPAITVGFQTLAVVISETHFALSTFVKEMVVGSTQLVALAHGDISGAAAIGREWKAEAAAARVEHDKLIASILGLGDVKIKLPLGNISDDVTALSGKMNELHAAMKASGGVFLQADEAEQKLLHTHQAYNFAMTEMVKLEDQYKKAKADPATKASDLKDMEKRLSDVRDTTKAVSESIKWEDALTAAKTRTLSATTDRARKLAEIDEKSVKEHASYAGALAAASSLAENLKAPNSGATSENIQDAVKEVTRLKTLDLAVDKQRALAISDIADKELAPAKRLIESLKEKEAAQLQDIAVTGKQTELQKESAKWLEQVSNGTYKGTEAMKIETAVLYERLLVGEETNIANEKFLKLSKQIDDEGKKEIEILNKKIIAQEKHNAAIGKTPAQIAATAAEVELLIVKDMELEAQNLRTAAATVDMDQKYKDLYIRRANEIDDLIARGKKLAGLENVAAADEAAKAITAAETKWWEKMFKDVDGFAHTAFNNIFEKGKNAFEEIGKVIKSAILDMLYKMTVQKWLFSVGIAGGGTMGAGAALAAGGDVGTAGGGGGSWLSAGKSLYDGFSGAFTYDATATTGLSGMFNAAATSSYGAQMGLSNTFYTAPGTGATYGTMSNAGSALGTAGSYVGAGLAGIGIGTAIAGDKQLAGISGQNAAIIGTAIGMVIGGPIGGIIGGTIGGIVNAAFGMGPKQSGTTTLAGQFNKQGFAGQYQTPWSQEGGWFSSGDSGVDITAVSKAQSEAFKNVVIGTKSVFDNLIAASGDANKSIDKWTYSINQQVSTEAQANELTIAMAESMGNYMIPALKQFKLKGESLADTAVRMRDIFIMTDSVLRLVGGSFGAVGLASMIARDNLVNLMGGLQQMNTTMQSYYQNFFSDTERHANDLGLLTLQFIKLGVSVPKTAAEFRNLVESQDLGTASGRQMFASLMSINAAFTAVIPSADAAAQAVIAAADAASRLAEINLGWQQKINVITGTQTQRQVDLENALKGADVSTASLINQFFALQTAFDNIKALQDNAIADYNAARNATDSLRTFALSVRELQKSLWAGSQTPLSSTYDVARSQFASTNLLAGQGNTTAQGNLANSATTFLDAAKKQATSAIEYARDFAFVQNALTDTALLTDQVVTVADKQLEQLKLANAWLGSLDAKNAIQNQSLDYLLGAAIASSKAAADAVVAQQAANAAAKVAADAAAKVAADAAAKVAADAAAKVAADEEARRIQGVINYFKPVVAETLVADKSKGVVSSENALATQAQRNTAITDHRLLGARAIAYLNEIMTKPQPWDADKYNSEISGAIQTITSERGIVKSLGGIPGFSTGINAGILPADTVLQAHGGEEIRPAKYVDRDRGAREETNALLARLVASNDEMKKELVAIKSSNYRIQVVEEKWDIDGAPEVRAAA